MIVGLGGVVWGVGGGGMCWESLCGCGLQAVM